MVEGCVWPANVPTDVTVGVTACEASSFCTSDLLYIWRGDFSITRESLESLRPFLPNASAQEIRSEINSCQPSADTLLSM